MDAQERTRIDRLEAAYTHLDERVNLIGQDVASMKSTLDSQSSVLKQIAEKVNAPNNTNWIGVGSLLLAVILAGSQYVDLRIGPMFSQLSRQETALDHHATTIEGLRGTTVNNRARIDANVRDVDENKSEHIEFRGRLRDLERQAAAAEVSRKAIGDYLKTVDELGSRKWVSPPSGE